MNIRYFSFFLFFASLAVASNKQGVTLRKLRSPVEIDVRITDSDHKPGEVGTTTEHWIPESGPQVPDNMSFHIDDVLKAQYGELTTKNWQNKPRRFTYTREGDLVPILDNPKHTESQFTAQKITTKIFAIIKMFCSRY